MKRLGIVIWFDDSSGEGMVYDLGTGHELYVHYSAIDHRLPHFELSDKLNNKMLWRSLRSDDLVEFSIYRNLYSMQIDKIRFLEPDFDYQLVNTCLEMCFRRGIDPNCLKTRYDI